MDSYNTRTDKSAPVWNLKGVRLLTTSLASVQTAPSHKPQAFLCLHLTWPLMASRQLYSWQVSWHVMPCNYTGTNLMNQLDIPESWLAFQSIFYLEVSGSAEFQRRVAVMTARTNRQVFVDKDQESVSMIRYANTIVIHTYVGGPF